jgi:hypothetical protein
MSLLLTVGLFYSGFVFGFFVAALMAANHRESGE